jgi:hypothetical protein
VKTAIHAGWNERRKRMFKVGDKVTHELFGNGKVIGIDQESRCPVLVEFIKWHNCLHDGYGNGKDGHCRWFKDNGYGIHGNIKLLKSATLSTGDRVNIIDGSGSMRLFNGHVRNTGNIVTGCTSKLLEYEIIGVGLNLPSNNSVQVHHNDVMARSIETNDVVFTSSRFVKPIPEPPKPVDFLTAITAYSKGKTVESDYCGHINSYSKSNGGIGIRDDKGIALGAYEILDAKWYIKEE